MITTPKPCTCHSDRSDTCPSKEGGDCDTMFAPRYITAPHPDRTNHCSDCGIPSQYTQCPQCWSMDQFIPWRE